LTWNCRDVPASGDQTLREVGEQAGADDIVGVKVVVQQNDVWTL